MKNKENFLSYTTVSLLLLLFNTATYAQKLPTLPVTLEQNKQTPKNQFSTQVKKPVKSFSKKEDKNISQNKLEAPVEQIPHGKELVSIDFPTGVNLSDIIKTVGVWTGKNFVLGQGVSGGAKISIISQEPVTKEEAYQAFLSALNISGFTTVETGKIVKVLPIANAKSSNIKTYYGESWAPATDEIINHVVPLHYIDVNSVVNQLRPLLGLTQYVPFTTTNSLILTDTGNRIRRILEIIRLLDDKVSQSQVSIVPINYTDAKDMASKVTDIFGSRSGTSISLQKAIVDERTNSLILVGPAHTLDDIVRFIQRIDKPALDQGAQALIRVRPLDYADAEKLAQTLQALTQNANTRSNQSGGARPPYLPSLPSAPQPNAAQPAQPTAADLNGAKITADKSTNSLIIEGSKSAFNELDLIISQLDKRKAQVYIEANIVDLSVNNGLNWSPSSIGGASSPGGNATVPFGFNVGNAVPFATTSTASTASAATAFGNLASSGNAVLGILSNKTVNIGGFSLSPGALIFALKTDAHTNVLQTPSMMVSDNETANFESAQEFNVIVNSANPNGSGTVAQSQKYQVTTSLKVTPQISRSDFVNLKINLQLDDAGASDANTGYPSPINKRSAESVVTVQDGQSAVLGGITKNSTKNSESKVPLLGDIPVVGWLFKQVINTKEKTNLTLLVTPHVVRDSDDLAKIYEQKLKDRDDFLRAYYGTKFKQEDFYANLPTAAAGKAPLEKEDSEDSSSQDGKEQKESDSTNQRKKILPSKESNPINAPASGTGGGSYNPPVGIPSAPSLPMQ